MPDGIVLHGIYGTSDLGYRVDTMVQEDIVRNTRRESVPSALCSMTPGSSGQLHVISLSIPRFHSPPRAAYLLRLLPKVLRSKRNSILWLRSGNGENVLQQHMRPHYGLGPPWQSGLQKVWACYLEA